MLYNYFMSTNKQFAGTPASHERTTEVATWPSMMNLSPKMKNLKMPGLINYGDYGRYN